MFAVMKKIEMSWDNFPIRYIDYPFSKAADFDLFDRDEDNKRNNKALKQYVI